VHSLLKRQLEKAKSKDGKGVIDYEILITLINEAYNESDKERRLRDSSMALLSDELMTLNASYKKKADESQDLAKSLNDLLHYLTISYKKLEDTQERFSLAIKGANDGIWDWDLVSNEVFYSPRWKMMLGYQGSEMGDTINAWFNRVHPDDLDDLKGAIYNHLSGVSPHMQCEYRMMHKNSSYVWFLTRGVAIFDDQDRAIRMAGSHTDITESKMIQQQLIHHAFHDVLTELPNRALFMDRLNQVLLHTKRNKEEKAAVLFLDLDNFKRINDTIGHDAGDEYLSRLGKRLLESCRAIDTVARFGGDEFVILLTALTDYKEALTFAKRIQKTVEQPLVLRGQEVLPSFSIGVAPVFPTHESPDEIVADADFALYHAKTKKKGSVEFFEASLRNRAKTLFHMENSLRSALDRGEIKVFYQPIVHLKTGQIAGFESLMRWNHPDYGLVSPKDFIPIAEETDLIVRLGFHCLEKSCHQILLWNKRFKPKNPWFISVNLSAKQLFQTSLCEEVKRALDQSKLEPNLLKLEITESLLITKQTHVQDITKHLKRMGVGLSIDDFGTGYSSLSTLHSYDFDTLKIDHSFVSDILRDKKSQSMLRSLSYLARSLCVATVIEGVESKRELEFMKTLDLDYVQGFFFSKPLDVKECETFLSQKPVWPLA